MPEFTMSMYKSKEDLYKAKSDYLQKRLILIKRQVEKLQDANNGIEYRSGLDELFNLINKDT